MTRPRAGRIGTLAEHIAVDEADLALNPKNISMAETASIPLVSLTAWQALGERAKLKPGDIVLIHAGSGGVSTLARHFGETVWALGEKRKPRFAQHVNPGNAARQRLTGRN